jgi:hypothetical protein
MNDGAEASTPDADDGIRFGTLLVTLCPNPATAERALADLLTTAAISADQGPLVTKQSPSTR